MLEEILNNCCILSVENIAKWLSYEVVIEEYAAKICRKTYYRGVSGS
jgi:hypothetical protein